METPAQAVEARRTDRSKVELIKEASDHLRGSLASELGGDEPRFGGDSAQLLKFHGVYQQEDRDQRKSAREEGGDRRFIFMVRMRIPGGRLSAAQYLAFDELAGHHADGTLRLTTRQTFQLHGVIKSGLKRTIREINDALVMTLGACGDVERNVVACPAPGDDAAHEAMQRLARELSDGLLPRTRAYHEIWLDGEKVASTEPEDEPLYGAAYLPRKFKTGIALPGDNCIDLYTQDLGFLAILDDGVLQGVNVLVGGGLGMTHGLTATYPRLGDPMAFVTPDRIIETARAVIAVYRDFGDRTNRKHARLKYVVEEWGIRRFTEAVQGRLPFELEPPRSVSVTATEDHLGWHRTSAGSWYLGVHIPNGRIKDEGDWRAREALRRLVEQYRPGVHLTPQQNILFSGFQESQRTAVDRLLVEHGLTPAERIAPVRRFALACPAMPTCGLAVSEAERVMPAVLDDLERRWAHAGLGNQPLAVRMTGCPNGCARPYTAEVGIVGRSADRYNVYLGGTAEGTALTTLFAELIPLQDLGALLAPVFEAYRDGRLPGEAFGAYCGRIGVDALRRSARVTVDTR